MLLLGCVKRFGTTGGNGPLGAGCHGEMRYRYGITWAPLLEACLENGNTLEEAVG